MDFGKVAVMMGGKSAEREVSLKSGAAVLAALRSSGVDAHSFDPQDKPLEALHAEGYRRVFIALHGRGGEDGTLQGALDLLAIPYTGSGVLASALAMDKWRSKLVWQASGLPVPEYVVLDAASDFAAVEARLGLPLFVKPSNEGSSIGISKVKGTGELRAAYELAARYDPCVIAEQFLGGGEFTVGILAGQALPVIRIVRRPSSTTTRPSTCATIPSTAFPAASVMNANAKCAIWRCAPSPCSAVAAGVAWT
jgi:D-alanine-D-alanine ligase